MDINKWKKAVIHLECATDSEHYEDKIKRIDESQKLLNDGKITEEEYIIQLTGKSRDIRSQGTAIFLKHNEKRYLVTARHVVWDKLSAEMNIKKAVDEYNKNGGVNQEILNRLNENATNEIFRIIFRVPSIEEISKGSKAKSFLMNLQAGGSYRYTFSNPNFDLAIISLDFGDSTFADELIDLGFEPIAINDIESAPIEEGKEVFTVGFPQATSLLGQLSISSAENNWSSSYFSAPVFSFGKISMFHNLLNFFWTDMSIYPGNSGGPVILENKLVGVISAQALIDVEGSSENLKTRIPFGKIIRAKYILELLKIQEDKEKNINVSQQWL
ncbi:serine protease [Cellulophaga baltica 4]|nr:serine protease [Cellulophaga baltica 4]